MKILGYTFHEGEYRFTMKCDSSLLNQKKPFFLPDWSTDLCYCRCLVARISRLGKCIEQRFAPRYYDAVGTGLNFRAEDILLSNWAEGTAFDNSLCVGELLPVEHSDCDLTPLNRAIAMASAKVTLRNGDLVFIDLNEEARPIQREQVIEEAHLYCKIK